MENKNLNEIIDKCTIDLIAATRHDDKIEREHLIQAALVELRTDIGKIVGGYAECGDVQAPKVDLGMPFNFADSRYVRGKNGWLAASLYKKAEEDHLQAFDVPLASVDLSIMPFKCKNMDDFLWHLKRVMAADTNIPIIYDDYGQIADGNHRVARAILDGKRYIHAYRLKSMPPIDYTEEENSDE